jgi:hypothetical protein
MLYVVYCYMFCDCCITLSPPTLGYNCKWLPVSVFIFSTFILWGFLENLIVSELVKQFPACMELNKRSTELNAGPYLASCRRTCLNLLYFVM